MRKIPLICLSILQLISVVNRSLFAIAFQYSASCATSALFTRPLCMAATAIDGKGIAAEIRNEIKSHVSELSTRPGLAVILVGERRDSQTYVKMKKKACSEIGIASFGFDFPETAPEKEILDCIEQCNKNPLIHGILVQLPLPPHIEENVVLNAIAHDKDVDGLHPRNVAQLSSTSTHVGNVRLNWENLNEIPFPIPCTPQGCIELLDRSGIILEGKRAVVIGRSNLVGIPVALLLMHRNATITIAHSRTDDIKAVVKEADIVIAAVGKAYLVQKEWIKPGAVIIDVGINSLDDPTSKRGYKLVGDVDYEGCKDVASLLTPVPGGVGPMTIAMLMRNTVNACIRSEGATTSEE
mmetsp:Transcript_18782/g.27771  ORF Transcript_18782/g.27771 Transcript_18782/m.27771 type:complete len:353 (+) Transcript_18782:55-1113(+)